MNVATKLRCLLWMQQHIALPEPHDFKQVCCLPSILIETSALMFNDLVKAALIFTNARNSNSTMHHKHINLTDTISIGGTASAHIHSRNT